MITVLRELFEPRTKGRSSPGELTWHHPRLRHGVYIRNDGVLDLQTQGSVVGIGTTGICMESPALYVGVRSLAIRAERFGCSVPPDGYYLSGRRLHPELVRGRRVLSPLWNAKLLVLPGSLVCESEEATAQPLQPQPLRVGDTLLETVSLQDLFRALEFTEQVETEGWIDEAMTALMREMRGGDDAG